MCRVRDSLCELGASGVVVLLTWELEAGESAMVTAMGGNWYAQNGMMQHVLKMRDARVEKEVAEE